MRSALRFAAHTASSFLAALSVVVFMGAICLAFGA